MSVDDLVHRLRMHCTSPPTREVVAVTLLTLEREEGVHQFVVRRHQPSLLSLAENSKDVAFSVVGAESRELAQTQAAKPRKQNHGRELRSSGKQAHLHHVITCNTRRAKGYWDRRQRIGDIHEDPVRHERPRVKRAKRGAH